MQAESSSGNCLKIFHLEDSLVDAEILRRGLKNISCSILQIFDDNSFATALKAGQVDVIISDCNLPSFDTFEALSLTRQTRPDLPFIFFSDNDSPRLKEKVLAQGAAAFISKRNLSELIQLIGELPQKSENQD
jgi:CheY-like chemotaxis protein